MTRRQQIARMSTKLGVWAGVLLLVIGIAWAGITFAARTDGTHHPDVTPTWTPSGLLWNLTVQFLSGNRQGQREHSLMTFLPDGRLTATFPDSAWSPTRDGRWSFTSPNAFHYSFRVQQPQDGRVVLTQMDASLTSPIAYEASGVSVIYSLATAEPVGSFLMQAFAVSSGEALERSEEAPSPQWRKNELRRSHRAQRDPAAALTHVRGLAVPTRKQMVLPRDMLCIQPQPEIRCLQQRQHLHNPLAPGHRIQIPMSAFHVSDCPPLHPRAAVRSCWHQSTRWRKKRTTAPGAGKLSVPAGQS